jgi:hypothetical protein
MDQTARVALPFLAPGQVRKELQMNESLQRIDLLLSALVEGALGNDPPVDPVAGQSYLVGEAPTGAWDGNAGAIAGFTEGGWRFVMPPEGAQLLLRATGETMVRRNGGWETGVVRAREIRLGGQPVLASRQPPIDAPAGGETVDAEARSSIAAVIATLRAHGLIESQI